MTTKQELINLAASYTHRADLVSEIETDFFPLAESRIGKALMSQENEKVETLSPASNQFAVPTDYGSIRALVFKDSTYDITLKSLDLHSMNNWKDQGGDPQRYLINNRTITVRPFSAGNYDIYYWRRPNLSGSAMSASDAVGDAYPQLYVYALAVEVAVWSRSQQDLETFLSAFNGEIATINRQASRAHGDKPAMRRA